MRGCPRQTAIPHQPSTRMLVNHFTELDLGRRVGGGYVADIEA
jgi:hypothetical protein